MPQHSYTARRWYSVWLSLALLTLFPWFISGCNDKDGHPGPSGTTTLTKLTLDYTEVNLPVGLAAKIDAMGTYSDGTTSRITDRVSWSISDDAVASVDGGKVRALQVGTATVTAYCDSLSASAKVTVNSDTVLDTVVEAEDVTIIDGTAYMPTDSTAPARAYAITSSGAIIDLTDVVEWSSSDTSVAEVKEITAEKAANKGLGVYIITHRPGKAVITATDEAGKIVCRLSLVVTDVKLEKLTLSSDSLNVPVGMEEAISVTGHYSDGTSSDVTAEVTWSSSDASIADVTVSEKDGKVAAKVVGYAAGTATVTAAIGNAKATCKVTVTDDSKITKLEFDEVSPEIFVGESGQLTVIATLADGTTVDVTDQVEFTTDNPDVAVVESAATGGEAGKVTGIAAGTATITATIQGQTVTIEVTVKEAKLTAITIDPQTVTTPIGLAVQLKAVGVYDDGTSKDVTSSADWTSSAPAIATVSKGKINPLSVGTATITATIDEISANCALTVEEATLTSIAIKPNTVELPVGLTAEVTAEGTYNNGETRTLTDGLTWISSNNDVATVTDGVITAAGVGNANVTVKCGSVTSSACAVTVSDAELVSIAIDPIEVSLAKGNKADLKAYGTFTDSSSRQLTEGLTWKSSKTSVATVSSSGKVTAKDVGTANITVKSGNITSSACAVTVTPATLDTITIDPDTLTIVAGLTDTVHAYGDYSDGTRKELSGDVTWSSDSETYAAVTESTATGATVKGLAEGTANISASYDGVTSSNVCAVTVSPATVVGIAITKTTASTPVGLTIALTAKSEMSDGTTSETTPTLTWSSSDTSVATVNEAGVVTGVTAGTATISAVSGDIPCTQTCVVTVTDAVLQTLEIEPNELTLIVRASKNVTAKGHYSDGTTATVTEGLTWSTSNADVATVADGTVTGVAVGNANITVKVGEVVSSACAVTVSDATLESIAIDPDSATLIEGQTATLKAMGTYSDGTTEEITNDLIWSSNDTTVASVDEGGVVTAVAEGTAEITVSWNEVTSSVCSVTVSAPTLQSIAIQPTELSIMVNDTAVINAVGTYDNETTKDISDIVTWTSSEPTTAAVTEASASGATVKGKQVGNANISASYSGVTSTAPCAVTVTERTDLTRITLNPSELTLSIGLSEKLEAMGTFGDGSTSNVTDRVTWSVVDGTIAEVTEGTVKGLSAGTTEVVASCEGVEARASVTVTGDTVESIAVEAANATMQDGKAYLPTNATSQLHATATTSGGSSVDVTETVTWDSTDATVAEVKVTTSAQGKVVNLVTHQEGNTSITATDSSGVIGTLDVVVTGETLTSITLSKSSAELSVGMEEAITATGLYSDGSSADVTSLVTWDSTESTVASVVVTTSGDQTTAKIVGYASGNATITAAIGDLTATCEVTVNDATITALEFDQTAPEVVVNNSVNLTVSATLSDGTTKDVTDLVDFSTDNSDIAIIESATTGGSAGKATGVSAGTVQITATLQGMTATVDLLVKGFPMTALTYNKQTVTGTIGVAIELKATAAYQDGTSLEVTDKADWTSSAADIATVSKGKVTPVGSGTATITAKLNGFEADCTVEVQNAELQSITLTPATLELSIGQTATITAEGTFSNGETKTLTDNLTWTTSDGSVATVDGGTVKGLAAGDASITVKSGSVTSSACAVTVKASTLESIAIEPDTVTLVKGATATVKAYGTFSDGSTAELTENLTWISDDTTVASVSEGVITGKSAGTTSITVKSGDITSSACNVTVSNATLESITIEPDTLTIGIGLTDTVHAYGEYSDGTRTEISDKVQWYSDSETTAMVIEASASGATVKGTASGSASITAAYEGVTSGNACSVTISSATVESIAITDATASTAVGMTVTLKAQSIMSDGTVSDTTPELTWTSDNPDVATVRDGVVTGVSAGTAVISAVSGDISCSQTCTVTVSDAVLQSMTIKPATLTLIAAQSKDVEVEGTFSDGTTRTVTENLEWSTDNADVATVADGRVTGVGVGTANITVKSGDVTSSACAVEVVDATLASIALNPSTLELIEEQTGELKAIGTFSDDRTEELTTDLTWHTSNADVATVENGVVTAKGEGAAEITVEWGGVTSSICAVTVTQATLQSISISPATLTLTVGDTDVITASGTYDNGTTKPISDLVEWSSSNAETAAVTEKSADGATVTAYAVGTADISASYQGVNSTTPCSVTVNALTVQSIVIGESTISLAKGLEQQLTAQKLMSNGTYVDADASELTWASSNTSAATVNNGLVTAVGEGTAEITATLGSAGCSRACTVTVTAAELQSLALEPDELNLFVDDTAEVTVKGTFSDGSTQTITEGLTWYNTTSSVATVDGGTVTAKAAGTTQITVGKGDIVSSACAVTVQEVVLQSISLDPDSATLHIGESTQLTVSGTYNNGQVKTIANDSVTWDTSAANIAEVSAGKITAKDAGEATITATVGECSDTCAVTVLATELESISISPETLSIAAGNIGKLKATGYYNDGTSSDVTSLEGLTWSVSSGSEFIRLGSVDDDGLNVEALAKGTAVVTAATSAITADNTCTVTVTDAVPIGVEFKDGERTVVAGETLELAVSKTMSDGTSVDASASELSWTSSATSIATVEDGVVRGLTAGETTITATLTGTDYKTQTVVTVSPATVKSVAITPSTVNLIVGLSQDLTVEATYSDNHTATVTENLTWNNSAPEVASLSGSKVTGVSEGTATLTVTYEGVTSSECTVNVTPATLESITLTPATVTMEIHDTLELTATGHYSDNTDRPVEGDLVWQSTNNDCASVSAGVVTANAAGTADITVTCGDIVSSKCTVTVNAATITSITVSPEELTVDINETGVVHALANYSDGSQSEVLAEWSSSNTAVATIPEASAEGGIVHGKTSGTATVTATYEGMTSTNSCVVTVPEAVAVSIAIDQSTASVAKGLTTTLTAKKVMSDGTTVDADASSLEWFSTETSVATVNNGEVTAVSEGTTTITATLGELECSSSCELTVTPAEVVATAIQPSTLTIVKGLDATVEAYGIMSDGTTSAEPLSGVVWSVSTEGIVSLNNGTITAIGEGTVEVSATYNSLPCQTPCTVTVSPAELVNVLIEPSTVSLIANGPTQTLTAKGYYTDSTTQPLTQVDWSSSNSSVAMVSTSGVLTPVSAGTADITVTYDGKDYTCCTVTVTAEELVAIDVSPTTGNIVAGSTMTVAANGSYNSGRTLVITSDVEWSSSAPSVAICTDITDAGMTVKGLTAGSSVISAKKGGITSRTSCALTVAAPTLQSITLNQTSLSAVKGGTVALKATGNYSDGSSHDITTEATWGSSDTNAAYFTSFNASGEAVYSCVGIGTNINLTASMSGITSDACVLTVNDDSGIVSIELNKDSINMRVGSSATIILYAINEAGVRTNISAQAAWSAEPAGIVAVDHGAITAIGEGTATVKAVYNDTECTATIDVVDDPVQELVLDPTEATMLVGDVLSFTAKAVRAGGEESIVANWTSDDTDIVTVDAKSGKVTAIAAGTTSINAEYEGATASAEITVEENELLDLVISPTSLTLAENEAALLTVEGIFDQAGSQAVKAVFSSSNSAVATVNPDTGVVTAIKAGTAVITAEYQGLTAECSVSVSTPPPFGEPYDLMFDQFPSMTVGDTYTPSKVWLVDTDGNTKDVTNDSTLTWDISDPSVLSYSASTRTFTALAAGTATVSPSVVYQGTDYGCMSPPTVAVSDDDSIVSYTLGVSKMTVSPDSPGVPLQVFAVYANGAQKDVTAEMTAAGKLSWFCTDNVGSISNNTYVPFADEGSDTCWATLNTPYGELQLQLDILVDVHIKDLQVYVGGDATMGNAVIGSVMPQVTFNSGIFADSVRVETDDPSIAIVYTDDANDVYVVGLKPGLTSLRAVACDGSVSSSIPISVTGSPVDMILFTMYQTEVPVGGAIEVSDFEVWNKDNEEIFLPYAAFNWVSTAPDMFFFIEPGIAYGLRDSSGMAAGEIICTFKGDPTINDSQEVVVYTP